MYYHQIPHSFLKVSIFGLGSMTFGEQIKEKDAHCQLNFAINAGINFIDTAEMYPVPSRPETQGLSEKYIGNWLKKHNIQRDKLVIASKVSGPAKKINTAIRHNQILDYKNIHLALENSLQRLKTDYIDLYQIHWPQRTTNCFGKLNYQYVNEQLPVTLLDTLEALNKEIKNGKIRYIGISNETPWGALSYLQLAEKYNLPRIITIQNPYSLLNRSFEIGLAEISQFEKLELVAYSSLAFGTLTGKYLNNTFPNNARNTLYKKYFTRYNSLQAQQAITEYVALAELNNLDPAQMALAFVRQQPFVASILLGVTSIKQLQSNLNSLTLNLSQNILSALEQIHTRFTIPAP
ncbi:NADP(H)-dependent aldo-keto reductase [Blochmannia endosymbiont of Camponotus (Colobopsis) obliquus]|uniref:NADP(H)-dependent aldo-keto reductase n=1 Tax=Blochmannia endosymbiont of Camponotus (Colobopsis) obliquus TaxID=1505597 RepID=UPI00061A6F3B|nr:NADP(H)-dependent aldo-keto reductase [Blochmannia endosymbiont of Camponotus (Colobopsis) obliquus]AKC60429.1 protein tas [Blochmannia endosymbiont of Camponotus (Colobopsis) obliquus]